jgi:hypothetical protein
MSYSLSIGLTHRHVLLDQLLPVLLHIKATAILEDALELRLTQNGHALAKPYKDDLNGRLTYLADRGLLSNVDSLHEVRRRRNALAHEPDAGCDWAMLRHDIRLIEAGMIELGLVDALTDSRKSRYVAQHSSALLIMSVRVNP